MINGICVKMEETVNICEVTVDEDLDDLDFALSYITKTASKINEFPINNSLNARVSSLYFDKKANAFPERALDIAALNISKACDKFGIEVSEAIKLAASRCPEYIITNIYVETNEEPMVNKRIKVASTEQSKYYYALVKQAGDGKLNAQYAMPDASYIKTASDYFDKHCKSFSVPDRHKYASNVYKRSAELGAEVTSENILKYAGVSFNSNVGDAILLRKTLLDTGSEMANAFDKLASYQGTTNPDTFANVLFELDKKAGLDRYYGSYLPDPYISTFATGIKKTASSLKLHSGEALSGDAFKKMAAAKYSLIKNYFGATLADGLKKEGAVAYEALPNDAKEIIARIANGEIN